MAKYIIFKSLRQISDGLFADHTYMTIKTKGKNHTNQKPTDILAHLNHVLGISQPDVKSKNYCICRPKSTTSTEFP